ncbi:uncharacterized protein PADG_08302 [Paracoccidioides brasiliensis Pb18]|uniref:Pre-rRNA processing protein n=1 Tax=Paracoccidioides brasiliensis (strain Pb18) TaxID=502780 RepID=C1GLR1_PARBD|nr:uncharacterized protein PADG_08302 [Paracoccidioides brasiliensis Pb18]EEH43377.1 hypothetical protein PADG_08302 [Paracoccidioides brasiliensis Pb18]
MAGDLGDESSPLLGETAQQTPDPPACSATTSICSNGKARATSYEILSESTPLLAHRGSEGIRYLDDRDTPYSASREPSPGLSSKQWKKLRIVRLLSIAFMSLILATIVVLGLGFAAPAVFKQYSEQAAVFKVTGLSIDSFTPDGVKARFQGSFVLNASQVLTKSVRDLGRLGTWLAREIESDETEVQVSLPEYGNVLLGTATIPRMTVNVRNGHMNRIEFITNLNAGDIDGIRIVANDWLQGRLGQLHIKGMASVRLRSGILYLGSHTISESFVFQDQDLPAFPEFNITKLNFHEITNPGNQKAMVVDISVLVLNQYPIALAVPPMGFKISVPNCSPADAYIPVINAATDLIQVIPNEPVNISAKGSIGRLPDVLTTVCPGTNSSPLDSLVENYIHGLKSKVYIRGGKSPSSTLPSWMEGFLNNVTIPVPFSGHALGHLVRNFSMTNVYFSLPEPFAEPDTPEAQMRVSALVKAVVNLPSEMNFPLNISRVRSTAFIYYQGKELGYINLKKWQQAHATRIDNETTPSSALLLEFDIEKAPLQITDGDTFTDVVQALLFQHKPIPLHVKAKVDAETVTALGQFVIRDIPASGNITVKPPTSRGLIDLKVGMDALKIVETTESSVLLEANLNLTNPTNYSVIVPYVNLLIAHNGTNVGDVTAQNLSISPGLNAGIKVNALWNPLQLAGDDGVAAGRDMISRYISGFNTSITLKSHKGTIPAVPTFGLALSPLELNIPVPQFGVPGEDDRNPGDHGRSHFIKDATLHLWTSTAVFTLASPLSSTTLLITCIDATAFYNHSEPAGTIKYDLPFAVLPGISQTPRLPVDLNFGGAGYEAIRQALGGTLKMDAVADVCVQLGEYSNEVSYKGMGISAKIRI